MISRTVSIKGVAKPAHRMFFGTAIPVRLEGGDAKGVDEAWMSDGRKVLARFDVVSDANGEIAGTFAAANANGGVFNGLTLVGALPPYVATGIKLIIK